MSPQVNLAAFDNSWYSPGRGLALRVVWLVANRVFFQTWFPWPYGFKRVLLQVFGARVGRGLVIKPQVKITFPWKLTLGDHVWLGEECWLLNLAPITLGSHVCISQRAFLCTGNHDYTSPSFDLITKPITVEAGAWIGAGAFVGPGVTVGTHAVLTAGSVATKDLEPYGIYRGNPGTMQKSRKLNKTKLKAEN